MGTGDIAVPAFLALLKSGYETLALVTQPDKPVGRKQILTPPTIKVEAQKAGVEVLQPEKVKTDEAMGILRELDADVFVVMAYGQILPQALIDIPNKACINLHASLLPKHRGASCIQAAIAAGDTHSGMTVMHVSLGLDEGDMILKHDTVIGERETGGQLHDRLGDMGPAALLEALAAIKNGQAQGEAQDDALANYAPKLMRQDGALKWSESAQVLERLIRAYEPWPGTYTTYKDAKGREKRLKIYAAVNASALSGNPGEVLKVEGESFTVACGAGALEIYKVQPEGAKVMEAKQFLANGALQEGDLLGV